MIASDVLQKIDEIRRHSPTARAALLPILKLVQRERGWLSHEFLAEVARILNLSPAMVESTASFYSMLHRQPVGQYVIEVCTNLACSLLEAETLLEHLKRKLGIEPGQTTADGRFTLKTTECLGACDTAPVVCINGEYHEALTTDKLDRLLVSLTAPPFVPPSSPSSP